jgi:hypothetical protein
MRVPRPVSASPRSVSAARGRMPRNTAAITAAITQAPAVSRRTSPYPSARARSVSGAIFALSGPRSAVCSASGVTAWMIRNGTAARNGLWCWMTPSRMLRSYAPPRKPNMPITTMAAEAENAGLRNSSRRSIGDLPPYLENIVHRYFPQNGAGGGQSLNDNIASHKWVANC